MINNNFYELILKNFKIFLDNLRITSGTQRSYLSDIRHFLGWYSLFVKTNRLIIKSNDPFGFLGFITKKVISEYCEYQTSNKTPVKTINRRLSSLRKFGEMSVDQGWLSQNIFNETKNIDVNQPLPEDTHHLNEYRDSLLKAGYTSQTIKSYLSDTRHFINWMETNA